MTRATLSLTRIFKEQSNGAPFRDFLTQFSQTVAGRPVTESEITPYTGPSSIDGISRLIKIISDPLKAATDIAVNRKLASSLLRDGEPQYGLGAKVVGAIITAEEAIAETIRQSTNKALSALHEGYKDSQLRVLGEIVDKKPLKLIPPQSGPYLYDPRKEQELRDANYNGPRLPNFSC